MHFASIAQKCAGPWRHPCNLGTPIVARWTHLVTLGPANVGVNPALTIAALAEVSARASRRLLKYEPDASNVAVDEARSETSRHGDIEDLRVAVSGLDYDLIS